MRSDLLQSIGGKKREKKLLHLSREFSNETVKISTWICWLYGWGYINIFILNFGNLKITEDTRLKSQYWPEICINMLMVPICGTLQGQISSRLPRSTADLKTEPCPLLSFELTCTLIPWHWNSDACFSAFSQVCGFQHRVYCVPEHMVPLWLLLKGKLHLFSALAFVFVYFNLRKSSLWRSLTIVNFLSFF